MTPLVSVIVPNYNHGQYLAKRLESIFNQTFQDFEVILLDDFSNDNSLEILKQYADHPKVSHFIVNKKNSGSPFKQWKLGVELAKGEYIWMAESDDWAKNYFLEVLVSEIDKINNCGLAFCDSYWVNDTDQVKEDLSIYKNKAFVKDGLEEIKEQLIFRNTIQNVSSAIIKRENLIQIKSDITKYTSCGDWILYTEVLLNSKLLFIPEKMNYFRWYHNNTSNVSRAQGLWITEGIDVLKIAQRKIIFNNEEKKYILKFWLNKLISLQKNRIIILFKLFKFSPLNFIKIYLNNVRKSNYTCNIA